MNIVFMRDIQNKSVILKINNNTLEAWRVKMRELEEMAKLTCLVRERTITAFISDWKPLIAFLLKREKSEIVIYGFDY